MWPVARQSRHRSRRRGRGTQDRVQRVRVLLTGPSVTNGVVGQDMAVSYLNVLPGATPGVMIPPVVAWRECRTCTNRFPAPFPQGITNLGRLVSRAGERALAF